MHQLVCCLDSRKVKRAEGGNSISLVQNKFIITFYRENKRLSGLRGNKQYTTANGPFCEGFVRSGCVGPGASALGHTYINRTFDQGLGQVDMIRLTFGPTATSHLPGSVER